MGTFCSFSKVSTCWLTFIDSFCYPYLNMDWPKIWFNQTFSSMWNRRKYTQDLKFLIGLSSYFLCCLTLTLFMMANSRILLYWCLILMRTSRSSWFFCSNSAFDSTAISFDVSSVLTSVSFFSRQLKLFENLEYMTLSRRTLSWKTTSRRQLSQIWLLGPNRSS